MLKEFIGKKVSVHCGIYSAFAGADVGTITRIDDRWLQLETNREVLIIDINRITRVKAKK